MAYIVGQNHAHLPDVVLGIDGAQPVDQKSTHFYFTHQHMLPTIHTLFDCVKTLRNTTRLGEDLSSANFFFLKGNQTALVPPTITKKDLYLASGYRYTVSLLLIRFLPSDMWGAATAFYQCYLVSPSYQRQVPPTSACVQHRGLLESIFTRPTLFQTVCAFQWSGGFAVDRVNL